MDKSKWVSVQQAEIPEGETVRVLLMDKIRSGRLSPSTIIRVGERVLVPSVNAGVPMTWTCQLKDLDIKYWLNEPLPELDDDEYVWKLVGRDDKE